MKQPNCPWCGMGWESWTYPTDKTIDAVGKCGSLWFPDFPEGHTERRKQSAACQEIARQRAALLEMDRLLESVPDLVKTAFQEGFSGNAGTLGKAWEKSSARMAIEGQGAPRPVTWGKEKEENVIMKVQISQARAALRAILPHLAETQDDAPAYRDAVRAVRDAVGGDR